MMRFRVLGVAAIAGFALAAIATATTALGAETASWLVNGTVPLEATEVLSGGVGELKLEDMGVPAAVECTGIEVTDVGTVGQGYEDTTNTVTFNAPSINCRPSARAENLKGESVSNACESVKNVAAVDLPWLTELSLGHNGKGAPVFLDKLSGDGKGEPGYLTECKTALGTVDDTCTEVSATFTGEGRNEGSDVVVTFPKELTKASEAGKCSIGGAESGLVVGEQSIEVMGGTLAASEVQETEI